MKKQPRGRPPKEDGELRGKSLLVRLDVQEQQAFKEAADAAGLSLSGWVRERLRRMARRELQELGRPVAFG